MTITGKKLTFYAAAVILVSAIILLTVRVLISNSYRNQIPGLSDLTNVEKPLLEQLSLAYSKAHNKPTASDIGMLGMVYHSGMYYDKAAKCYELAIKINPKEWLWSYYLGYLKRETGELNATIENFKNVTRINPSMYLSRYYMGEALQSLGKNSEAEAVFSLIPGVTDPALATETRSDNEDFPLNTYARFQLARLYGSTQRPMLEEKTLNDLIETANTFGPAYRQLGNLYIMKGDTATGKDFLIQADDLTDNSAPVDKLMDGIALLSRSGQYLLRQIDEAERRGQPRFAVALTYHALKYMPDDKYLISKAVKLLLNMNLTSQVEPFTEQHYKMFHDDFSELKEVANLMYSHGMYSQALTYYIRAEELVPRDHEAKSSIVLCLWQTGKKDEALKKMDNLVLNDRENLRILEDGVYTMLVLGEKQKAVIYLNRLIRLASSDPRVLLLEGMAAEMDGKNEEAVTMYRKSFDKNPKDMAVIHALANSLTVTKQWSSAIEVYRKALLLFPNEPFLMEKLGTLLISCPDVSLRNLEAGRKLSERVFIHKASTPDLAIAAGKNLAMSYAAEGNYQTAKTYAEWALGIAKAQKAPSQIISEIETLLNKYKSQN